MFAEHGFRHATVREICRRAGANVNAVKYYFQDKRGIYLAALEQCHQGLYAQLMAAQPQGTPHQRLRWFVGGMLHTLLGSGPDPRQLLLLREMIEPTEGLEELVERFIRPRFELLCEILGQLGPAIPLERVRLIGYSLIGQCMHYKVAMPAVQRLTPPDERGQLTPDRLAEHICEVTLAAIARWSN